MNLHLMMRDARPTGGIWQLEDVLRAVLRDRRVFPLPMAVRCEGGVGVMEVAQALPYGSVLVVADLEPGLQALGETLSAFEWREWNPPGREPHETCYVRSHWDGNTYGSHQRYLLEAVRLTTGPVLELGSGDGSTRALHEVCTASGRLLVTVDSDVKWIERYTDLMSEKHKFEHLVDPAKTEWLDRQWGVVFIDHAPGESRAPALMRARDRADFCVVHDTEDEGYQIWSTLESFKHKRHFRFMRPWTSVVSMTREIFPDPYGIEI